MKRSVIVLAGAAVAAGGFVALGPRAHVDWSDVEPVEVPELTRLDAWLAAREARFDDLVPGTEKRIVWYRGRVETTTTAIVYIHGFSASRQELAPLPERVASALGANLFETRLAGHGRSGEALAAAEAEAWVADTKEAIEIGQRLGERVIVLGCSTGATLDAIVSSYWPQRGVAAHVWISPNFGAQAASARVLTWPWARTWVPWIAGERRTWEPANEAQGRYWTTSYPIEALFPMQALVDVAQVAPLERVRAPTLVIHSTDDPVIRSDAVEEAFERLGAETKARKPLTGVRDAHVLAGDIMAPGNTERVTALILDFMQGAGLGGP